MTLKGCERTFHTFPSYISWVQEFFFPRVWRVASFSADTSLAEVTSPNPETVCGKSLALRVLWAQFISFLAWRSYSVYA